MESAQRPDLTAQFDQASAGVRDIARLLGAYLDSLVASGFTRDEAMAVVLDYQHYLLTSGQKD